MPPSQTIDLERSLHMYRQMAKIRAFEEQVNELYKSAKMPGLAHLYTGEEAIAVGVCEALRRDDYITSTHRGHGHCLAKGAAVDRMFAELLGKEAGYCRGKGGSMHLAAPISNLQSFGGVYPDEGTTQAKSPISTVWRVMAERMVTRWTTAPHLYLMREVNASRLIAWREKVNKRAGEKITFTDLLVKIVAVALRQHPRVNAAWRDGTIVMNDAINVGVAVAVADGLIVPVIQRADTLSIAEIAAQRGDVVARAQAGKLRLDDIQGGTFTLSNLGMYLWTRSTRL